MIIAFSGLKNTGKDTSANMLSYCISTPRFMHSYWLFCLLYKLIPHKYKVTSFAHPLKRTLAALLDVDIEKFEDRDFKENWYIYFPTLTITNHPDKDLVISDTRFTKCINNKDLSFLKTSYITIRQLLQVFGTELARETFGDKIWILSTLTRDNIIISDLRFEVEADEVHNKNGRVVYIDRPGCNPGGHASEKQILDILHKKKYEWEIHNNGTKEHLFNKIKDICYYWGL